MLFRAKLIALLVFLIVAFVLSKAWQIDSERNVRSRTATIVKSCPSDVLSQTVLVVLLPRTRTEAAMAAAACFSAARCPQRVFIAACVSEETAPIINDLLRSSLRSQDQPEQLSDNFRFVVAYGHAEDDAGLCIEECHRNETFTMIIRGRAIFRQDFDDVVTDLAPKELLTQFCPRTLRAPSGYPLFKTLPSRGAVAIVRPFARRVSERIPISIISHQCLACRGAPPPGILSLNLARDSLQVTSAMQHAGWRVTTTAFAVVAMPDYAEWDPRGFALGVSRPLRANAKYGLSATPSEPEILAKIGSVSKFHRLQRQPAL